MVVSAQTSYICANDPSCVNHRYCSQTPAGVDICLCNRLFHDTMSSASDCTWASGKLIVVNHLITFFHSLEIRY